MLEEERKDEDTKQKKKMKKNETEKEWKRINVRRKDEKEIRR